LFPRKPHTSLAFLHSSAGTSKTPQIRGDHSPPGAANDQQRRAHGARQSQTKRVLRFAEVAILPFQSIFPPCRLLPNVGNCREIPLRRLQGNSRPLSRFSASRSSLRGFRRSSGSTWHETLAATTCALLGGGLRLQRPGGLGRYEYGHRRCVPCENSRAPANRSEKKSPPSRNCLFIRVC